MKYYLLIAILLSQYCTAQNILIDSCGLDNDSKLNKFESEYFNQDLNKQRGTFNFNDMHVAFTSGHTGKSIISKNDYFNMWGRAYFKRGNDVVNHLFILTVAEKEKTGGYDAIIVTWAKLLTENSRPKIIKKLSRNNKDE